MSEVERTVLRFLVSNGPTLNLIHRFSIVGRFRKEGAFSPVFDSRKSNSEIGGGRVGEKGSEGGKRRRRRRRN